MINSPPSWGQAKEWRIENIPRTVSKRVRSDAAVTRLTEITSARGSGLSQSKHY
jgi:hypothetical protein